MTDSELATRRLREAFAATSPHDVATRDCPPPESIWDAVREELPPRESRSVLRHLASCPVCTEAWRLARELDEEQEGTATDLEPADEPSGRAYGRFGAAGALAATLAYFAVAAAVDTRLAGRSLARDGQHPRLELTSAAVLPRSECSPAWTALDGALYQVEVSDENLELVASAAGLSQPTFQVPEAALAADATLLIYVMAYSGTDGRPLAERTVAITCRG